MKTTSKMKANSKMKTDSKIAMTSKMKTASFRRLYPARAYTTLALLVLNLSFKEKCHAKLLEGHICHDD